MNRIEMIHRDFDTAVETLVKIADEKQKSASQLNEPKPQSDYEDGKFLESIGFVNTVKAIKAKDFDSGKGKIVNVKTASAKESKAIMNIIQKYQTIFPFHKFILYSQVINICEKYNLFLAPVEMYKGDIPSKNIEELKNFDFKTYKSSGCVPNIDGNEPICAQALQINKYNTEYIKMYICAPRAEFIVGKNTLCIGKELYNDHNASEHSLKHPFKFKAQLKPAPKDPIVLIPVQAFELGQIGFIVNTKWGLEANDPALQVGINN